MEPPLKQRHIQIEEAMLYDPGVQKKKVQKAAWIIGLGGSATSIIIGLFELISVDPVYMYILALIFFSFPMTMMFLSLDDMLLPSAICPRCGAQINANSTDSHACQISEFQAAKLQRKK